MTTAHRPHLTPRQRDVLRGIAEGKTNAAIADELGIGFETVKMHVSDILAELGVESREEAAAWWRREQSLGGRARAFLAAGLGLKVAAGAAAVGALLVVAVVVGIAVSGDDESDGPGSPEATPAGGGYPVGTRTGVPEVDRFLGLHESNDVGGLLALLQYRLAPCTTETGLGVLECLEGEPEGTIVEYFPFASGCQGSRVRKDTDELVVGVRSMTAAEDPLAGPLYAVVMSPEGYGLFFTADGADPLPRIVAMDPNGRVTTTGTTCAVSADEELGRLGPGARIVLAPPS
jgi:DNA-binding CsgD family transcriptional regulator